MIHMTYEESYRYLYERFGQTRRQFEEEQPKSMTYSASFVVPDRLPWFQYYPDPIVDWIEPVSGSLFLSSIPSYSATEISLDIFTRFMRSLGETRDVQDVDFHIVKEGDNLDLRSMLAICVFNHWNPALFSASLDRAVIFRNGVLSVHTNKKGAIDDILPWLTELCDQAVTDLVKEKRDVSY